MGGKKQKKIKLTYFASSKDITLVLSPPSKLRGPVNICHSANIYGPSTTFQVLVSVPGSVVTVPQKDTALRTSLCEFDDNLPGETLAETKCFRRVVKSKGTEAFFPWICVLIWILFEDAFLLLFW